MTLNELKSLKKGKVILYGKLHYKNIGIVMDEYFEHNNQYTERSLRGDILVKNLATIKGKRYSNETTRVNTHNMLYGVYNIPEEDVVKHFAEYLV